MSAQTTKNDFPTWFAPAFVKELRQGLRTPAFMITLALVPVAMSLLFMGGFIKDRYNDPFIPAEGVNVIFWLIICFSMIAIFPLRALQSVKSEISSRTADMLVLTKLTPWRIVLGKWTSYTAQILLTVCSLLPFLFVRYYYGSVNVMDDMYWMFIIVVLSCLITAMSIWISGTHALLKGPYMIGLLILAGAIFAFIVDRDSTFQNGETWLFICSILITAILAGLVFLILASQCFSLPADNTSKRLRWVLLALALVIFSFFTYTTINRIAFDQIQNIISTSLFIFILIVLILDLMNPSPFLPVHVAKKGGRLRKRLNNLLFVPGFSSSALFSLAFLLILLTLTIGVNIILEDGSPPTRHYLIRFVLYMMMFWSGMVITGYFLQPLLKKWGKGVQIIYFLAIGLLLGLSALLQFWDLDPIAMIIPWGNLIVEPFIERNGGLNEFSNYYVTIITLLFIGACACVVMAARSWRRTIARSKQLDYLNE